MSPQCFLAWEETVEQVSLSKIQCGTRSRGTNQALRLHFDLGSKRGRCAVQSLTARLFESISYSCAPIDACSKDIEEEGLRLGIRKRHGCSLAPGPKQRALSSRERKKCMKDMYSCRGSVASESWKRLSLDPFVQLLVEALQATATSE
jgi:hypothetical protein